MQFFETLVVVCAKTFIKNLYFRRMFRLISIIKSYLFKKRITGFYSLLLILTFNFHLVSAQNIDDMSFEHLSIEDGLGTLYVTDILQDHQGFMWFGSLFGLNKYDGYTITTYNFDRNDPYSISGDRIRDLFEDSEGTLWIATANGGLNKYIRETDSFVSYQNNPSDSTSISHNFIRRIYEDKKGTLWIGTMAGGLNKMNKDTGTFTHYLSDRNDDTTIYGNYIFDIFEDTSKRLWIGVNGGLSVLDRNTGKFFTYKDDPSDPTSFKGNRVLSICEDSQGILWFSSDIGLNKFNDKDETFSLYKIDSQNKNRSFIDVVKEDNFGNLWLGSLGTKGLIKFDKVSKTFTSYQHDSQNENSLGAGFVTSIFEDRSNILWVGTNEGGVNIYKPQKASNFILHKYNTTKKSISAGIITSIRESSEGEIWFANDKGIVSKISVNGKITHYSTFKKEGLEHKLPEIYTILIDKNKNVLIGTNKGIFKLNKSTNFFEYQTLFDDKRINDYPISSINEDKKGNLWLRLGQDGLMKYNKEQDKQTYIQSSSTDSTSLSNQYVNKIYEDPLGTLWIATADGLNKKDRETDTFTRYQHNPLDSTSISNSFILNLYKDYFGSLWVATYNGLNVLNEKTGTFRHFYKEDGLPENKIHSILEDNHHNLWIATKNHLSKFNPKTETFRAFNKGNGMSINEFRTGEPLKARNGKMYFRGANGLLEFHPDSIKNNTYIPPIVLTDFKISNQSAPIKRDSLIKKGVFFLNKNITITDTINMSYLNNNFSFEFTALDYVYSLSNQYAYRMKGFNEDWIYTDSKNRSATYTNLDPGSYVFEVKGSNNDGLWNEKGKSVVVIITPPWWKTNWAYFIYLIGFIGSLFWFIQWRGLRLKRERKILIERVKIKTKDLAKKNTLLDKQNLQLQAQTGKLKELDETKSKFFANISHEFRTPLTVILGLINKQINNIDSTNINDSESIKRNADRLLQLINQLLDLSKIESGEVKLTISKQNILSFVKKIILLFESYAKEKNIKITFNNNQLDKEFPDKIILANVDKERCSKIITNLISNAIKFTNRDGSIEINVYTKNENLHLNVANSGEGILKKNLPFIFNRFYQVDDEATREYEGTGIGLALVKELVELHQGNISVESNSNKTTFSIVMPLNLIISEKEEDVPIADLVLEDLSIHSKNVDCQIESNNENPDERIEILVVEDNTDIRNYIKDILDEDYKVILAVDGKDGLEKAEVTIPDLIISDVMMPKMDGYELCKHIKTSKKTNHIPIILLTAKATQENKLEGLETGADDYLIKPFDEKELRIRIKNLISLRAQLQMNCQQKSWLKVNEVKVTSVQEKFIEDIKSIIENNIDNSLFGVEDLGNAIAMSRSQVHRKLKAITDQSATQFIRNYRLHRAAELIKQDAGNITEIAYQVGFSSQTYFSKCFQELFESSPSEYKS